MAEFLDLQGEGVFAGGSDPGRLEDEYKLPFQQWKDAPTPQSRSQLLTAINPVIDKAISAYGGPSRGSPMLRSRARRMALHAFQSYDPQRASLRTHLMNQLKGLQRPAAQEAQIIHLPEAVALQKRHLDEMEEELTYRYGRPPSTQQLADATGLSMKRIAYIRQAQPTLATGTLLGDTEDTQDMPASSIPGQDLQATGWEELIYYDLDEIDQYIFDHTLGRHGAKAVPLKQIAQKLGITPSAASQRAARIQRMLDEQSSQEIF